LGSIGTLTSHLQSASTIFPGTLGAGDYYINRSTTALGDVIVSAGGSGYPANTSVILTVVGGTCNGQVVADVGNNGAVENVTVLFKGTGYTASLTVPVATTTTGTGLGCTVLIQTVVTVESSLQLSGHFYPGSDSLYNLGSSTRKWNDAYIVTARLSTSPVVSSDRNKKINIAVSDLGLDFINDLIPVSYVRKNTDEEHDTTIHYGLIAQEVEETLTKFNKTDEDFGGYVVTPDGLSLRYEEFIAPIIKAIQELKQEIDELKANQ
jgi:hypothetical protein